MSRSGPVSISLAQASKAIQLNFSNRIFSILLLHRSREFAKSFHLVWIFILGFVMRLQKRRQPTMAHRLILLFFVIKTQKWIEKINKEREREVQGAYWRCVREIVDARASYIRFVKTNYWAYLCIVRSCSCSISFCCSPPRWIILKTT